MDSLAVDGTATRLMVETFNEVMIQKESQTSQQVMLPVEQSTQVGTSFIENGDVSSMISYLRPNDARSPQTFGGVTPTTPTLLR